jgi:hypothetical protein
MESNSVEVRYERKFVLDALPPHTAEAAVRRHPAMFLEEFPARFVNSLYLDSPLLRRYYEHRAGVSRRAKIRIRWYEALSGPASGLQLEVKQREGACSIKHREPLSAFALEEMSDARRALAQLRGMPLPAVFLRELADVEPVLVSRFRRRYFRSVDRRIRLTIDAGIEYHRSGFAGHASLVRAVAPGLAVLELKYAVADAAHAAEVGNAFPFRVARMSKYVLGVELLRAV